MISVIEAKSIIQENTIPLPTVKVPLANASGCLLAEDIFSALDIPSFNQSALDGYAFAYRDWNTQNWLNIKGTVPAGDPTKVYHTPEHAIRIFTGAPIPDGADTVVMQEKTIVSDDRLFIEDPRLQKGNAIRLAGSEIRSGELALEKGTYCSPAAIGFLATLGIQEVPVLKKPSISIIVTGNELQKPGNPLGHGQVYESNSFALVAALQQLNMEEVRLFWVDDRLDSLVQCLSEALSTTELVLLTGGVSVGDYDFVLEAAKVCGVTKLFHRIKQKPGKPLYFGKKEDRIVFGLPGNPSSVLTCFYEYVIPALQLLNPSVAGLKTMLVPINKSYKKAEGIAHFLKAYYDGETAQLLDAQESYKLSSFAKSNCLIYLNDEITIIEEGDLVEVHLLPN